MFNKISNFLLTMLVSVLLIAATTSHAADTPSPEQVVAEFQKVPHYVMFCLDERQGGRDSTDEEVNLEEIYEKYFSKEFNKLFMWNKCSEPDFPPKFSDVLNYSLDHDFRFGIPSMGLLGEKIVVAKNIRTQAAKQKTADKAIVKVLYGFGSAKNLVATYTLIREEGRWKIDDIALKGYATEVEEVLPGSSSIKTDIQNYYRAAEEHYQREQAKKGNPP